MDKLEILKTDDKELLKELQLDLIEATKKNLLLPIFKSILNGSGLLKACENAGLSYYSFYLWVRKYPHLQEFLDKIEQAQIKIVEDSLFLDCIREKGNVASKIFYLTNKAPAKWKNRQYNTTEKSVRFNLILSKPEKPTKSKSKQPPGQAKPTKIIDIKE